jgi:hypothetical protein
MVPRRVVLASAIAFGMPRLALGQEAVGQVGRREGSVVAVRGADGLPLEVGAPVYRGDGIRTGPGAKVHIDCPDGLVIVVGPLTEVDIDLYLHAGGGRGLSLVLDLLAGITRLIGPAEAAPERLEIETRAAVASVRSTDWLVDVTSVGSAVFVREGSVDVRGRAGGAVLLQAGEGTDVPIGEPPREPRRWGEARRAAALARTTL